MITDKRIRAKIKFIKEYEIDVWVHIFDCSNSMRAIRIEDKDRRWLIPRVTEQTKPDAYWRSFHAWLRNGGLGIVRKWADDFLKSNEPVLRGQHAPSTTRKNELIEEGRSDSYKIALDLARGICEEDEQRAAENEKFKNVVIAVEDVRQWAADRLGLKIDNWKIDKPALLLKALKEGGLIAAVTAEGKNRRFDITAGHGKNFKSYVVTNFDVGPDDDWEKIKNHYRGYGVLGSF